MAAEVSNHDLQPRRRARRVPPAVAPRRTTPRSSSGCSAIQTYHTPARSREFVQKLAATPDGDGSLLDHSLLLYGSNMSNSNAHDHFPLPMALVGGGCGRIKGGQHLRYPDRTPMSNLLLTLLQRAGVPVESLGDSTGELAEV